MPLYAVPNLFGTEFPVIRWTHYYDCKDNLCHRFSAMSPASKVSGALWRRGVKRKESFQLRLSNRKSRCEMLIGGDCISNEVITLGTCFSGVCLHSQSFPLCADWRKSDREPQGNWRWNSNSRDVVASSPFFSRPAARTPRRACSQAICNGSSSA